jgi:hypothetical protein
LHRSGSLLQRIRTAHVLRCESGVWPEPRRPRCVAGDYVGNHVARFLMMASLITWILINNVERTFPIVAQYHHRSIAAIGLLTLGNAWELQLGSSATFSIWGLKPTKPCLIWLHQNLESLDLTPCADQGLVSSIQNWFHGLVVRLPTELIVLHIHIDFRNLWNPFPLDLQWNTRPMTRTHPCGIA